MTELKPLLLKIASLPLKDQRWLLKQLTPQQRTCFAQHQGVSLLEKARRFAGIPIPQMKSAEPMLPDLCSELANQPPLYVAIILEQGAFPWAKMFLTSYQQHHNLQTLPDTQLLKPATKAALFKQWNAQLDFADHLEVGDGQNN